MFFRPAGLVIGVVAVVAVAISAAQAGQGPAPTIRITSPKDGAKVTTPQVQIVGTVSKPHDSVTVNGQAVGGLGPTSTIFQKAVGLKVGANTITATVTSGGLTASDSIRVTRELSTHRRRITMVHGVFPPHNMPVPWNGNVYMNDDFGKCIAHVKVLIQRKLGSRWKTILTVRTEGVRGYGRNGSQSRYFKNGPQPPPGVYRAYMPEIRFGQEICLPASDAHRWRSQP